MLFLNGKWKNGEQVRNEASILIVNYSVKTEAHF